MQGAGNPIERTYSLTHIIEVSVKGVDMAVMMRYTGRADAPIAHWLERMGTYYEACQRWGWGVPST